MGKYLIEKQNYLNITIPDYAYYSESEKVAVKKLLADLEKADQLPFPKRIDDEFKYLAKIKKEQAGYGPSRRPA